MGKKRFQISWINNHGGRNKGKTLFWPQMTSLFEARRNRDNAKSVASPFF
jgi:hypothetical protein